jgi:hypothetical protein
MAKMEQKLSIEAAILTYHNQSGLNALLWALLNQTLRPDGITIYVTGLALSDPQLLSTINLISKTIPVEISSGENVMVHGFPHLGLIREKMFSHLKNRNRDWIWLFDDDLIPEPTCLASQRLVNGASIPALIEDGRRVNPHEKIYFKDFYSKRNCVAQRGSAHGLLARVSDLVKIDLSENYLFEDTEILEKLKPTRVVDAKLYHTKTTTGRPDLIYAYVENLYHKKNS